MSLYQLTKEAREDTRTVDNRGTSGSGNPRGIAGCSVSGARATKSDPCASAGFLQKTSGATEDHVFHL